MKIDAKRIAKLANLNLRKDEVEKYEKQLSPILEYVNQLSQVSTDNIPETSQTTGLENVTKEDVASPSLSQNQALSNTKSKHNGLFKVKAIFEE